MSVRGIHGTGAGGARPGRWWAALAARPTAVFLVLSAVFGVLTIALDPPLRGPDELAHYLRVRSLTEGRVLPQTSVDGRLGIYLPAGLHDDVAAFEAYRKRVGEADFSYRDVLAAFPATAAIAPPGPRALVFVPYQGSEAYNPVAYLPHVAAGLIAQRAGLGFLATSYLMRLAGFVAFTGLVAWAIALIPRLKWAYVLIGLWPAALFERTVISADGAALAYLMVAAALCLRAAAGAAPRAATRSLWLTATALVKPPQLAFAVLELAARPWRGGRRVAVAGLVMLPAAILGPLWVLLTSAEVAAYRMAESKDIPLEQFDPLWKLGYMAGHPLHFPRLLANTLTRNGPDLARQLVGVHGWLDTPLAAPVYPVLAALLLATMLEPLRLAPATRARIAAVAGLVTLAYAVGLFLIFYLVWTPLAAATVYGVQGRYFVVLLPLLAMVAAAALRRGLPPGLRATAAVAGAAVSGAATLEALWRVNWT